MYALRVPSSELADPLSNLPVKAESSGSGVSLIISKVLDARRRGATTEAYRAIRRKPAPAKAGGGAIEGNAADDALMVYQEGLCP